MAIVICLFFAKGKKKLSTLNKVQQHYTAPGSVIKV